MTTLGIFIQAFASIILFLYGIDRFSHYLVNVKKTKIKSFFSKVARTPARGAILGCVITAILQSSTAVSSISVALVDVGILNFKNAMPIIFGAGVGTSSTALVASLKLSNLGSILMILGVAVRWKYNKAGNTIFYLGLVLFSVNQISIALATLKNYSYFQYVITNVTGYFSLLFLGVILTIIFQSSSLVTSLLVILVDQGAVPMKSAIILTFGAFIGTTFTAIFVSLSLCKTSKYVAVTNFIFSLLTSVMLLPVVPLFYNLTTFISDKGMAIAVSNSVFRLISGIISVSIFTLLYPKAKKIIKVK
jgi:phosphate:Na+ symporter